MTMKIMVRREIKMGKTITTKTEVEMILLTTKEYIITTTRGRNTQILTLEHISSSRICVKGFTGFFRKGKCMSRPREPITIKDQRYQIFKKKKKNFLKA